VKLLVSSNATAFSFDRLLERFRAGKRLELLKQLERLEQASLLEPLEPLEQPCLICVQSDGGFQSAGQTEYSFRQS
jgi:hypothetical protein